MCSGSRLLRSVPVVYRAVRGSLSRSGAYRLLAVLVPLLAGCTTEWPARPCRIEWILTSTFENARQYRDETGHWPPHSRNLMPLGQYMRGTKSAAIDGADYVVIYKPTAPDYLRKWRSQPLIVLQTTTWSGFQAVYLLREDGRVLMGRGWRAGWITDSALLAIVLLMVILPVVVYGPRIRGRGARLRREAS